MPLPPSPEEARRYLEEAEKGAARAQEALLPYYGFWLALWGGIYAVGYTLVALDPARADAAFGVLSLLGFLASYAIGFRAARFFKTPGGRALARLWAGFALAALALVLARPRLPGPAFSLAINLLVALALWESAERIGAPGLRAAAVLFAFANALFFAYYPEGYAPFLALVGLGSAAVGLVWGIRGLR